MREQPEEQQQTEPSPAFQEGLEEGERLRRMYEVAQLEEPTRKEDNDHTRSV